MRAMSNASFSASAFWTALYVSLNSVQCPFIPFGTVSLLASRTACDSTAVCTSATSIGTISLTRLSASSVFKAKPASHADGTSRPSIAAPTAICTDLGRPSL